MDQCNHCIVRGNIEKCLKTDCSYHDLWMVKEIKNMVKQACAEAVLKCEFVGVGDSDNISKLDAHQACLSVEI